MAITIERITAEQARRLLSLEEGQFADLKAIEVEPAKLTKHMSAFANTDGGDVYIGIDESAGTPKVRTWRGFANPESANGHIQAFEKFFPLGADFQYEFLRCDAMPGIVLHAQINKTKSIRKASNGFAFLRRAHKASLLRVLKEYSGLALGPQLNLRGKVLYLQAQCRTAGVLAGGFRLISERLKLFQIFGLRELACNAIQHLQFLFAAIVIHRAPHQFMPFSSRRRRIRFLLPSTSRKSDVEPALGF